MNYVRRGRVLIVANHPSLIETFLIPLVFWPWAMFRLRMFPWSLPDKNLFKGFTPEQYDRLTAGMEAHREGGVNHPSAAHVAAVTEDGMIFVDLWRSKEEFAEFAERELASGGDELGPLEPRFVPIHNRIAGKG